MASFDELLVRRRSTRRFKPEPLDANALDAILDAAVSGPSAGGLQAFRLVPVVDADTRKRLMAAALGQSSVGEAPLVLVCCADGPVSAAKYGSRGESLYSIQDATIACMLAWLKAVDLGLAAVWVGAFDEAAVARLLGLPAGVRPVALLPIGHADEVPEPKVSRPRTELVR